MANLKNKDIIYAQDLSKEEILKIIDVANDFKKKNKPKLLDGKIIATLFFEASTRTRLSFESATKKLGANTIGFSGSEGTSTKKGETLEDTIRMVSAFSDLIVMRHPEKGAAERAAKIAEVPVINGGDGPNQHPTQMLLDVFSIIETQKKLDELNVGMIGDLKYGRTTNSLSIALSLFNVNLFLISPTQLQMTNIYKKELDKRKAKYQELTSLNQIINDLDVLYVTRVQRERFENENEYDEVKNLYILDKNDFSNAKKNLKIMHPLPRVNELPTEFDNTPYAYYFQQAQNGLYVRQALLSLILGAIE